jgi:hypothetical protein
MLRISGITLLVGLLSVAVGCARPTRVVVRDPRPQVVVVKAGHVHTARCGHYRHGKTWYLVKGHVHGPRCGHVKVNGVWIVR